MSVPKGVPRVLTGLFLLVGAAGLSSCFDAEPGPEPIQLGRQIYSRSCASCHGDAASGRGAVLGAANHGPEGHTWHHADQQIIDIVLGRLDYPDRKMPSFEGQLNEEQVRALLAYFKTNWTPQQRAAQAEVTRNWESLQQEDQR